MEFQEFCKQKNKMCDSSITCKECFLPLPPMNIWECSNWCFKHPAEAEQIVEQWAKEHPAKTNADKFKEVFGVPFAWLNENLIDTATGKPYWTKWLNAEYQPPKGEEG